MLSSPEKTTKLDLESYLINATQNAALYEEQNFEQRAELLDFIEFALIDQGNHLTQRAAQLKADLEAIDIKLFQKLRAEINRNGYRGKDFEHLVSRYLNWGKNNNAPDYDNLDLFINGLLSCQSLPQQTKELEAGMVYFQKHRHALFLSWQVR